MQIVAHGRLEALTVPDSGTKDHAAALRPEQRNTVYKQSTLSLSPENVQDHAQMDKVGLALEFREGAVPGDFQGVCLHEGRRQAVVAKELVADVDKGCVQLGAEEVLRRRAIHDEFADVLAQTAADVEILCALLEAADHGGVGGLFVDPQGKELELSDAWIRVDIPCPVPLI